MRRAIPHLQRGLQTSRSRTLASSSRWQAPAKLHTPSVALSPDQSGSSVNPDEIAHFSRMSALWWDEHGEFGLLHKMNPIRVQFVREQLLEVKRDDGEDPADEGQVLQGLDVLDVGCGGGLLSESLARLGARTLGIDASPSNIAIASLHASADPGLSRPAVDSSTKGKGTLAYEHTSVEDLLARRGPKSFDVVCSMEVIEHVDNPSAFLANCAELVKPGGHLFLSTIARTPLSYALTIFAAENVLRLVEPGTHTWSKYINSEELTEFFLSHRSPAGENASSSRPWISRLYGDAPLRTEAQTRGMVFLPWKGEWVLVPRGAPGARIWAEACNYLFWVRRPTE